MNKVTLNHNPILSTLEAFFRTGLAKFGNDYQTVIAVAPEAAIAIVSGLDITTGKREQIFSDLLEHFQSQSYKYTPSMPDDFCQSDYQIVGEFLGVDPARIHIDEDEYNESVQMISNEMICLFGYDYGEYPRTEPMEETVSSWGDIQTRYEFDDQLELFNASSIV